MVADDPTKKIELKAFHCQIQNDHEAMKNEQDRYKEIPVGRKLDNAIVQKNYLQIMQDVQDIISSKMERVLRDPAMEHLVIRKQ